MMANKGIILETKNLNHIFPNGTTGLKDVNLQIKNGDFMVIAGANGSGKTVLMHHLNGLLKPTTGDVLYDGESIRKNLTEVRKNVGLIFQNSESQFVGQTVYEEVSFGPENLNLPIDAIAKITDTVLRAVDLKDFSTKNPHHLSGGQKRKLAVAGVLAMKSKVIIFDEPFTGLDYLGVRQVLLQLVELHHLGHTIILITHELEKVLAHANRLVVIYDGMVVLDDAPKAIIDKVDAFGIRMPMRKNEGIEALTWLV